MRQSPARALSLQEHLDPGSREPSPSELPLGRPADRSPPRSVSLHVPRPAHGPPAGRPGEVLHSNESFGRDVGLLGKREFDRLELEGHPRESCSSVSCRSWAMPATLR